MSAETKMREELFESAVSALVNAWCCEDAGDSADTERKWARLYAKEIADEYSGRFDDVYREVKSRARERYCEIC